MARRFIVDNQDIKYFSKEENALVADPEIISRGFVYMKESEDLLGNSKKLVIRTVKDCLNVKTGGWVTIKGRVRKALTSYLYSQTKRSPMMDSLKLNLYTNNMS